VNKAQPRKANPPEPATEDTDPAGPTGAGPAPDLVPHLWRFRTSHRDSRDADRMLRAALKLGLEVFGAPEGCLAAIRPGIGTARVVFSVPDGGWWDRDLLAGFLRGAKVRVPPDLMLARIRRQGRMWGALAIRSPGATFHWDARQALSAIGSLANELIDQIDRERVREVRARIDRKVLEQSQPKHLFYELLHGIRSLTAYDHSAALLTYDPERQVLEVVAEQVAWQKAKGKNVGRTLPAGGLLRSLLDKGVVCGFDRVGGHWAEWTEMAATALAELLDFDGSTGSSASGEPGLSTPPEGAILCAPLVTRGGLLGVLKVASIAPGSFTRYEVELVAQFLPQAAVALQNSRRAESLEQKVLLAERKHAMADLARGVSHDVNNALGVVLPLVQQLRDELDAGGLDPAVAAADLREVERAIQACRRIFGGMLSFARGLSRNSSEVSLSQAVDAALAILRQGLERRGVVLTVDVAADLPMLLGVQADVEQLLLNLLSNARDASRPGDALTVRAARAGDLLELIVEDTGCGIPREHLARIREPFFTTKPDGHGLGLAICRSIVAGMRGQLQIESTQGVGTRVRAALPIDGKEVAP
jgi:signal transduction histidine kinase